MSATGHNSGRLSSRSCDRRLPTSHLWLRIKYRFFCSRFGTASRLEPSAIKNGQIARRLKRLIGSQASPRPPPIRRKRLKHKSSLNDRLIQMAQSLRPLKDIREEL
jgi:hypothetical protein